MNFGLLYLYWSILKWKVTVILLQILVEYLRWWRMPEGIDYFNWNWGRKNLSVPCTGKCSRTTLCKSMQLLPSAECKCTNSRNKTFFPVCNWHSLCSHRSSWLAAWNCCVLKYTQVFTHKMNVKQQQIYCLVCLAKRRPITGNNSIPLT